MTSAPHRFKRVGVHRWLLLLAAGMTACAPAQVGADSYQPTTVDRLLEPAWWEETSVVVDADSSEPSEEQWIRVQVPSDVLFAFDSDGIGDHGRASLRRIVEEHQLGLASEIVVAGATDSVGSYDYNLALSRRRATSAVDLLIEAGVDRSAVRIEAWADDHPVPVPPGVDHATADSLQRRVVIQALLPSATIGSPTTEGHSSSLSKPVSENGAHQ